ncbi:uncharacterized protein [Euwallacea similis]|uniref:uncharacterized protein n=1 Tax=Euwallacea similis TaxID=1736056 RepID=UPI00344B8D88
MPDILFTKHGQCFWLPRFEQEVSVGHKKKLNTNKYLLGNNQHQSLITTFQNDSMTPISTFCALAYAKPQYNYPAPAPPIPAIPNVNYGVPGGALLGGLGGTSAGFSSGSAFSGNQISSSGNVGIGASNGASNFGTTGGFSGGTLVQKHIYVHVAPPEPEEVRPQRPISGGQSTKHYKIIFIKAPSYDLQQQRILQAQAQHEEKTLVYVLVKKPEDVADITLPTAAPTAPSKPEVYFIRYKARSEATASASAGAVAGSTGIGSGQQIIGGGSGIGSTLNIGTSGSSLSVGSPATSYGPPGASGPY